jgi:glycosyltransferase involved in cell wall biosynthesis
MNIAIISPEFPPITNWGGVATFNENLARLLSLMGHKVFVFTLNRDLPKTKIIEKRGYKIIYLTYKGGNILNKILIRLFEEYVGRLFPKISQIILWNYFSYIRFRSYTRKTKILVVHAPSYQSPVVLLGMVQRKLKIFLHLQGPQIFLNKFEGYSLDNKMATFIENMSLSFFCSKIITCSNFMKKEIVRKIPCLCPKIDVIPNFINLSTKFKNNISRRRIVYWGRLELRKGVDLLLKSFLKLYKINPDIELYLIGQPNGKFPYEGNNLDFNDLYKQIVSDNKIGQNIHIIPQISDRKVLFQLLDSLRGIAIFPSRYEPFGFVTIEAMKLGYLVVTSKNGGGSEIIKNNLNGFTIDPTTDSIKNTIEKCFNLTNRDVNKIIRNARGTINDNYTVKSIKKYYTLFYKNEIINGDINI